LKGFMCNIISELRCANQGNKLRTFAQRISGSFRELDE